MTHRLIINGDLVLTGFVGLEAGDREWLGWDGFTYQEVLQALQELGSDADISVRVNSGGGFATEGAAIYGALRGHGGNVTVLIEGIAASAASIIAMGGDKITIGRGATVMIHDPSMVTMGTEDDHRKSIDQLSTTANSLASVYAAQTGRSIAEERKAMKATTWLSAEDAVDQGYADAIDDAADAKPTAFAYRKYAGAPDSLVAMDRSNGWSKRFADWTARMSLAHAAANLNPLPKPGKAPRDAKAALNPLENDMTEVEKLTADLKAANEKITALTASVERLTAAKTDTEEGDDEEKKTDDSGDDEGDGKEDGKAKAERKRCADISAACALAGMPAKASAFITEGTSLEEAMAALQTEKAKQSADEISAHHRPGQADKIGADWGDVHAAVKAERKR